MTHIVAKHVTTAAETELTLERILTAGTGITVTDGGAGAAVTVALGTHTHTMSQITDYSGLTLAMGHEHVIGEDHTAETDGAKTVFISAQEFGLETIAVYLNGARQRPAVDYTEGATYDSITFTVAPTGGDKVIFDYVTA